MIVQQKRGRESMITKKQRTYFDIARKISELSDHPQYKIGCAVVLGHRIISSSCNSNTKTHPMQKKYNRYRFPVDQGNHMLHAEVRALLPLLNSKIDLSRAEIYTYRVHKNGKLALSKPCDGCRELIKSCGICTIGYTTDDGFIVENREDYMN